MLKYKTANANGSLDGDTYLEDVTTHSQTARLHNDVPSSS